MRTATLLTLLSLVLFPGFIVWGQGGDRKKIEKPLPSNPKVLQAMLKDQQAKIASLEEEGKKLRAQLLSATKSDKEAELKLALDLLQAQKKALKDELQASKTKAGVDKLLQQTLKDQLAQKDDALKAAQKAQQFAESEIAKARAAAVAAQEEAVKQRAAAEKARDEALKQLEAARKEQAELIKSLKKSQPEPKEAKDVELKAICIVTPFAKSEARGIVRFHQTGDTVTITGEITGLKPGEHGFHIHELGDVSGKDGLTTGGHYNPTKKDHGKPTDANRHVGDLGNITAGKDGKAVINMKDSVIRLTGHHSIIGRAVIIHHDADDFGQPVGHAGARSAGGVIGIAK